MVDANARPKRLPSIQPFFGAYLKANAGSVSRAVSSVRVHHSEHVCLPQRTPMHVRVPRAASSVRILHGNHSCSSDPGRPGDFCFFGRLCTPMHTRPRARHLPCAFCTVTVFLHPSVRPLYAYLMETYARPVSQVASSVRIPHSEHVCLFERLLSERRCTSGIASATFSEHAARRQCLSGVRPSLFT